MAEEASAPAAPAADAPAAVEAPTSAPVTETPTETPAGNSALDSAADNTAPSDAQVAGDPLPSEVDPELSDRPDWLPDKFWNDDSKEADVEAMAKSLKDTETALRNKKGIPEPTEDNPLGYDTEKFLEQGIPQEYFGTDEFVEYAEQARENGVGQDAFEWQLQTFNNWKAEYDSIHMIDIDAQEEGLSWVNALKDKFGEDGARERVEFVKKALGNRDLFTDKLAKTLQRTGDGLEMAMSLAESRMDSPGLAPKQGAPSIRTSEQEIRQQISKLRSDDPRKDMAVGTVDRDSYNKDMENLYKELAGVQGKKEGRKVIDGPSPQAQSIVEGGAATVAKGRQNHKLRTQRLSQRKRGEQERR